MLSIGLPVIFLLVDQSLLNFFNVEVVVLDHLLFLFLICVKSQRVTAIITC